MIPERVEDAWAVIATAWGWPPSEMQAMSLGELMDWEALAEDALNLRYRF